MYAAQEGAANVDGLGLAASFYTNPHGSQDRPYTEGTRTMTKIAVVAKLTALAWMVGVPAAHANPPAPCSSGQVQVSNGGHSSGLGHREVVVNFSLTPGAEDCTLTGYSGAGGPLLHAQRTMAGYLGGIRPEQGAPPTITITASEPGHAVVEGVAVDRLDSDRLCPTYTELLVTPPDTTQTTTIPIEMDTCELQVHPMGS